MKVLLIMLFGCSVHEDLKGRRGRNELIIRLSGCFVHPVSTCFKKSIEYSQK